MAAKFSIVRNLKAVKFVGGSEGLISIAFDYKGRQGSFSISLKGFESDGSLTPWTVRDFDFEGGTHPIADLVILGCDWEAMSIFTTYIDNLTIDRYRTESVNAFRGVKVGASGK